MVDDYNTGPGILGSLEDVVERYPPHSYGMALAIGYNNLEARWQSWKRIIGVGYEVPKLIHPPPMLLIQAVLAMVP